MVKFNKIRISLTLFLLSICVILSTYNKYWAPFDEGIVTVAAERILHKEVPYRDFFIAMYPPGQIYALAFLYKIFGISLEIGRFYTVLVQIFIALLVFLITKILTGKINISLLGWFIVLTCLAPRLGVIPAPIWPGMCLSLFSLYIFMKYIESERSRYIVYCGIVTGLATIFRHDIGIFAFISIFLGLLMHKKNFKDVLAYTSFFLIFPVFVLFYFILKDAAYDLYDSLILFAPIHEKTAFLLFPKPCLDFNMIFHKSLYFITANQYYIPLLMYVFIIVFLIVEIIKKHKLIKTDIMIFVILIFGILTFNQVRIRTDPAHLLTVIYPSVLLFGFLISKAAHLRNISKKLKYAYRFYAILIFFLFLLLVIKNIDKYFKNVFRKPYKKSIVLTRFERGSIYIPIEEKDDVMNVVSFIKEVTAEKERIYIGNIAHWKDDFGGSLVLYTLCERLPSTKYYEILPGLITQNRVQKEIAKSLSQKDVRFIILQDIDIPEKIEINSDKMILDNHIKENFRMVKKFGKYNIYEKRLQD